MALPTRGQPDWDDELGNHISNLEADLQSAVANASAAVSNANEARNVAQSVRNSVVGGTDVANAELINDESSAMAQALIASYATVAGLPPASGGDDRAAINAILSANAGKVVRGQPGESYSISGPLVIKSGTTLDMTGCTITLTATTNMLQNHQVVANNGRDSGIIVRGGTWVRGNNSGSLTNTHTLCFRRCDGLLISDLRVTSSAGKYAINLGDVTNFEVARIDFAAYSDGVHINGPASKGHVHHITGTTGDDSVAITGNDYVNYADVTGNVTDVVIEHVTTTSTLANNVKVLAGQGCTVDDITVRRIRGTHAQHAVWLGDDNGQASTDNGTHGRLSVKDVQATSANSTSAQVFTNFANGCRELTVEDMAVVGVGLYGLLLGAESTVEVVRVVRASLDGLSGRRVVRTQGTAGTNIRRLSIESPMVRSIGGNTMLLDSGNNLSNVTITNASLYADDTSTTKWVNIGAGATINTITVFGGRVEGGRDIFEVSSAGTYVVTGGATVMGINRIANMFTAAATFVFGDVTVVSATNQLIHLNTGATGATILGGPGAVLPASPTVFSRNGAIPLRLNGPTLPISAALVHDNLNTAVVVPKVGDMFTNSVTNGSLLANHPCVVTAVAAGKPTFKSLIDGATYTVP